MNVGAELLAARNARGLSLEELGARTKVSVERLDAIEQSDVERLPPRVYLLGFVKAYANEVGLDPDDVAQRYVAQVEQEWAQEVQGSLATYGSETVAPSTDAAPVTARSAPPPTPTRTADSIPLWRPAQFDQAARAATERRAAPPDRTEQDQPDDLREIILRPSDDDRLLIPLRLLLPGVVIAVALGVVLSMNLYKSGGSQPATPASSSSATPPSESHAAKPEREVSPATSDAATERVPPDPAASRATRSERPVTADTRESPSPDGISGQWLLTTRVDSSTYTPYKGLTLGYTLQLQQHGSRITGSGEKVSENGRTLPVASRTPITLEGTSSGQHLELEFTEGGRLRTSGGTLVMDVGADGSLRGRFSSDAAQSRGTAQATRASSTAANVTPKRDN